MESLTPRPGIREQYRHKADVLKASPNVRLWAQCRHRKPFALIAFTTDDDNSGQHHRPDAEDRLDDRMFARLTRLNVVS